MFLQEIASQRQKEKRDAAKPTRNDRIIASQIHPASSVNADGMPSVSAVQSANPAVVQVNALISPSVRMMSQTSSSQHKRNASVLAMASAVSGDSVPSTKSRNTDSLLEEFSRIQQQDAVNKGIKAHAAMVAAHGQQISQHIATLTWLRGLPASPFRTQATQITEQAFLQAQAQGAQVNDMRQQIPAAPNPPPVAIVVPDDDRNSHVVGGAEGFVSDDGGHDTSGDDDDDDYRNSTMCQVCHHALEPGTPEMYTPCRHRFHFICLGRWLNNHNTCPVCRAALVPAVQVHID